MNTLEVTKSIDLPMTTYMFKVVVERDDDSWHAYCPALLDKGAATWGVDKEEALKNIEEVVRMVVESMREHGEPLVTDALASSIEISKEPLVAITM